VTTPIEVGQVWVSTVKTDRGRRVRIVDPLVQIYGLGKVAHRNVDTGRLGYSQPSVFRSTFRLVEPPTDGDNDDKREPFVIAAMKAKDERDKLAHDLADARAEVDAWRSVAMAERERCAQRLLAAQRAHESYAQAVADDSDRADGEAQDDEVDLETDRAQTCLECAGLLRALPAPEVPR